MKLTPLSHLFLTAIAVVLVGAGVYFYGPKKTVQVQVPVNTPTLYEIDFSKVKTVEDMVHVLEGVNIRLQINLNQQNPETEGFKKYQRYFKPVVAR